LPKPNDAARKDLGGLIQPLGIAHQFGAQGVGASHSVNRVQFSPVTYSACGETVSAAAT
jgi:hypothetical protein